jgi:hypothetical protein
LDFGVARDEQEMGGFATGLNVKVEVVAKFSDGDHRIFGMLLGELLELGVEFVVDDGVLFKPADLAFRRFDFDEALAALDEFEGFSVGYLCHPVGDGGDAVVHVNLACGDVYMFGRFMMKTGTADEKKG